MRSKFFILFSLLYCGNAFSQGSYVECVSAFIHSDISKYSENTLSDNASFVHAPMAMKAFIQKEIPVYPASIPKNTETFVQEGYVNNDYYTFLSTRFSPRILLNMEICKQIIFLDFPDLFLAFEIRIYQILSEKTIVEQRIYWKKTSENSYHSFNLHD